MGVEIIRGDPLVVRADGEIDYGTSEEFEEAVDMATRESPKGFVIDLSDVSFIGSLGLRAILKAHRSVMESGGRVALVVVHPNAKEVFYVLNVDRLPDFFLYDSIEAAKRALSATKQSDE